MKNQDVLNKIESLIDTLKEIQISNNAVITELEGIKRDLLSSREAELRNNTYNAIDPNANAKQTASPDTKVRNTGATEVTHHTDRQGRSIEVGDVVHILSTGLFKGNTGTVTKIGKARITI